VKKIVGMGVPPLEAAAYVEVFNARTNSAGAHLSLSAALKVWKENNPPATGPTPDPEGEAEEIDEMDEHVDMADRIENDEVAADEADAAPLSIVDSPNGDHEAVTVSAGDENAPETKSRSQRRTRAR